MINKLFKQRYFPAIIQFFSLFIFIALIYGSIGIYTDDKDFAKILRNTNLANLIVWSYWWTLIILTTIIFGRFWCTICPIELITSFFSKLGLKTKPNKFIKSTWIMTILYAIILIIGIHTYTIHRIPQHMAIYMLILFIIAIISGLLWEKRTFCTYICPIGHLLGLYSLLSFNKLTVKNKQICESCNTKDCISKKSFYKFTARSCTSELYPPKIKDNRSCIMCGQCFNSCSKDNIIIKKQKFASDLFKNIRLKNAEIAFLMIINSFLIYEILSEWEVTENILLYIPNKINEIFSITGKLKEIIKAITLFLVFPSIFYFSFSFIKKVFSKETITNSLNQLTLAILPIDASIHFTKAILKISSRIPYWKYVFNDPSGINTAKKIMTDHTMLKSDFLTTISPFINILAVLLPIAGLILSFLVINKMKHNNKISKIITYVATLIIAILFIQTIFAWRF